MKITLFALVTLLHAASLNAEIVVSKGWVKNTVAGINNTAAFMILSNSADKEVDILSASSSMAMSVQIHRMKHENGVMHMSPVRTLSVPANSSVELNPMGLHIMLMGLKSELTIGQQIDIEFRLEGGETLQTILNVRQQGH
ncbi:MAG: copper chaperone PCu(A)C [Spongiibacteraceae bacterium]|nr:copper chaperone PCu(A)C [Spongiibacteraceae bacterium]